MYIFYYLSYAKFYTLKFFKVVFTVQWGWQGSAGFGALARSSEVHAANLAARMSYARGWWPQSPTILVQRTPLKSMAEVVMLQLLPGTWTALKPGNNRELKLMHLVIYFVELLANSLHNTIVSNCVTLCNRVDTFVGSQIHGMRLYFFSSQNTDRIWYFKHINPNNTNCSMMIACNMKHSVGEYFNLVIHCLLVANIVITHLCSAQYLWKSRFLQLSVYRSRY